ncbi:MAG: hypothetical protein V3V41_01455 [Candidatus Heimdallarchaeota archaeon]
MVYRAINRICEKEKIDHEPFYNSIEVKGEKILLFREKLVKETERRKSMMYEKYIELKAKKKKNTIDEIDETIEKLRRYFKERLVIFYKSSEISN